ncbi:MAG TPA: hypothetical protein PKM43_09425 [Verrucomicrobiota bacterium]|nr:hypothetical protein [Verrucomicrobiota bacterium]HRZ37817.1 hypothetical protein [Candidatus Paceibacterota bacterium]HRZ58623.1 hypothetical protein [Candidatus Paceibacterota bacterium]
MKWTQGPRSRTIANITVLPVQTRELIAASLKGQDLVPADQLQLENALDYGGLAVRNDAWSRFGLGALFADLGSARQRGLLQAVIYTLRRRFGIREVTFVFDGQKLASQVGRSLQRLKDHTYSAHHVDGQGRLQWERKEELIAQEAQQDAKPIMAGHPIGRAAGGRLEVRQDPTHRLLVTSVTR